VNAGDLLVIWVQATSETDTGHVTGITYSGTGAIGTAENAIQYVTGSGHPGNEDEIWYAPVTRAGAIALTFTWSGTGTASSDIEYSTQEFLPSASSSYSVDTTGYLADIASSTTVTFPSLTPTGGAAGELYAGYNSNSTSGSYGSATSGYTVESGGTGDAVIFDPDTTSSAQSPTAVASANASGLGQSAIGALIIATADATDTVTFNSEGGSAVSSQSGPNGSTITLPAAPTYAGYTFDGWFAASTGGSALASPYTLAATTTPLYAQWTAHATDTVTFNSEGGSAVSSQSGPNGSTITLPAAPTYAGYTFDGWFAASTGGSALASPYTLTATTTPLYAQWTAVSSDGGGGGSAPVLGSLSISASSQNVTVGSVVAPSTAAVSGLSAGDTATLVHVTFTFAGTGTTVYAASTTAPSAAGTYSVTPSAATLSISPSADASKYSTTYTYVAGSLVISPAVVVTQVVPHATRVIGHAIAGKSRLVTIIGRNFSSSPRVTSNESDAIVRERTGTTTRIVLVVTVRKGSRPGSHQFTITTDTGKKCEIGYVTR
jgi:uncharacterized repeat protein (TIGR02543 family)